MRIDKYGFAKLDDTPLTPEGARWATIAFALIPICLAFFILIMDNRAQKTWREGNQATAHVLAITSNGRGEVLGIDIKYRLEGVVGADNKPIVHTDFLLGRSRLEIKNGDKIDVRYQENGDRFEVSFRPPSPLRKIVSAILILLGFGIVRAFIKSRP